jgi:hypothetical protein
VPDKHDLDGSDRATRCGNKMARLSTYLTGRPIGGYDILGLSIRGPKEPGDDVLITVRALAPDGSPVVGFHGSPSLDEAFVGLVNRLENGNLRWKADTWAK